MAVALAGAGCLTTRGLTAEDQPSHDPLPLAWVRFADAADVYAEQPIMLKHNLHCYMVAR